jgi:hypothetical protein
MAEVVMIGSLLSSAGGFAAGASAAGTFLGVSQAAFGVASLGFSVAGKIMEGVQGSAAERARAEQLKIQRGNEKTQAAIEEAERQRRLRRTQATQRAAFAGGGADAFSGSPVVIMERGVSDIQRESAQAAAVSRGNISQINAQIGQTRLAGRERFTQSLISAGSTLQSGLKDLDKLRKKDG